MRIGHLRGTLEVIKLGRMDSDGFRMVTDLKKKASMQIMCLIQPEILQILEVTGYQSPYISVKNYSLYISNMQYTVHCTYQVFHVPIYYCLAEKFKILFLKLLKSLHFSINSFPHIIKESSINNSP